MTEERWSQEVRIMAHFPNFVPFLTRSGFVGFAGELAGPRTGRIYQVVVKARADLYPSQEPATYIEPRPEGHHWMRDDVGGNPTGKLCYQRDSRWKPACNTFANCVLIVIRYLKEFD